MPTQIIAPTSLCHSSFSSVGKTRHHGIRPAPALCHSSFSSVGKTNCIGFINICMLCHSSFSSVGKTYWRSTRHADKLCHSSFSSVGKTKKVLHTTCASFATVPFPASARPGETCTLPRPGFATVHFSKSARRLARAVRRALALPQFLFLHRQDLVSQSGCGAGCVVWGGCFWGTK